MRISGLAARTGVPVATLKYYLREGLLHPGTPTARTQAVYDGTHVDRVRLVRALTESAGLSLAAVRQVVAVLDAPPPDRHDLLGAAQGVLLGRDAAPGACVTTDPPAEGADPWADRAAALAAARGWYVEDDLLVGLLADQLRAADAAGVVLTDDHLDALAEAADTAAVADVASAPAEVTTAVMQTIVGTLLTDPVLLTMRRMAQQRASARAEEDRARPGDRHPAR